MKMKNFYIDFSFNAYLLMIIKKLNSIWLSQFFFIYLQMNNKKIKLKNMKKIKLYISRFLLILYAIPFYIFNTFKIVMLSIVGLLLLTTCDMYLVKEITATLSIMLSWQYWKLWVNEKKAKIVNLNEAED